MRRDCGGSGEFEGRPGSMPPRVPCRYRSSASGSAAPTAGQSTISTLGLAELAKYAGASENAVTADGSEFIECNVVPSLHSVNVRRLRLVPVLPCRQLSAKLCSEFEWTSRLAIVRMLGSDRYGVGQSPLAVQSTGGSTARANFYKVTGVDVVKLTLRDRESAQEAVRRFRKLVERSGIKKEMRVREFYEKPSETKRRARLRAQRRARRDRFFATH